MTHDDDLPESEPSEDREDARALAEALRAAFNPGPLSPALSERLLKQALEAPLANASRRELADAEALRTALEHSDDGAGVPLARALGYAMHPVELDPAAGERVLTTALDPSRAKRPNVVYGRFGAMAVGLGLAASVALWLLPEPGAPARVAEPEIFIRSRSLAPLFDARSTPQLPSERMDRIAEVRARELRENRFSAWGVR